MQSQQNNQPDGQNQQADEEARLLALQSLQILDTPIEERFERITRLASRAFNVPMCAISCIDQDRQWFKSVQGVSICQTDRGVSFCQSTIESGEMVIVPDARLDPRYADNPMVTGEMGVVFYAGAPIFSFDRQPIASLCIVDTKPRELSEQQRLMLLDFARLAQYEIHAASSNRVQDQLINQIGTTWRTSLVDPLTRLWNLDGIRTILDELLIRSAQCNGHLSCIMIDLSDFKGINASIGESEADELMRRFSKALLTELGDDCIVSRIDADQFVIVIDTLNTVKSFAQRVQSLQQFVDQYPVLGMRDRATLGGTMSAVYIEGQSNCSTSEVFKALDDGLFNAKALDESQITILGDPPLDNNRFAA